MSHQNNETRTGAPAALSHSADAIASGRLDTLARWLIRRAAAHTPPPLAERLEEEWLADLTERRSSAARLRLALGCCWATSMIARDRRLSSLAIAGGGSTSSRSIATYLPSSLLSGRAASLLIIVCLHLGIIYALATGLERQMVGLLPQSMTGDMLTEEKLAREVPPPANPSFTLPKIDDVPVPEVALGPTDVGTTIRLADPPAERPLPPQGPAAAHTVTRIGGGPGRDFPNTNDFYPPTSRRAGEAGVSTVNVCIDTRGRLSGEPAITESSGYPRLDDSALKLARAGSGRYRASTEDGKPVNSCYAFRVRFQLRD